MIEVKNLTLTYPSGKGVFDVDFTVGEGEVAGYLGPNGAGKTTTIRALMGFMTPMAGTCTISGLDCHRDAPRIQRTLGYIPGEIFFIDSMDGDEFLRFMHKMRGPGSASRQRELMEMFEFSPKGKIKKFSKGMKQKLGIVTAFMHDPDVIILDEPTSGLDPLMQVRFVEFILAEKRRGKTILMSSHMFEEIEKTCDNVIIIKDGRIIHKSDVNTLKSSRRKGFIIKSPNADELMKTLRSRGFANEKLADGSVEVYVAGGRVDEFIKTASSFAISDFGAKEQTLEDVFMQFYGKGEAKQ
jgi:ABC-type multidrug transport system, ATPase component